MSELTRSHPYPFLTSVCVYFVYNVWTYGLRYPSANYTHAIMRITPIFIVILSLDGAYPNVAPRKKRSILRYKHLVLGGLALTMAGVLITTWKRTYYPHGLFFIGVARLIYVVAFTFKPRRFLVGVAAFFVAVTLNWFFSKLLRGSGDQILFRLLSVRTGMLLYVLIGSLMFWRGISRWQNEPTASTGQAVTGVALLLVSDIMAAVDMLISPIGGAHLWIMMNTFIGSFLIGNSAIIDCQIQ